MNRLLQFFRERVWSAIPSEVTPKQRQIAAIAWPATLLLIGGVVAWRRRHGDMGILPVLLWGIAPLLALALMAGGAAGSTLYLLIMRTFATFGFFIFHLFLTIFFYLFVTPLALLLRAMGKDLIGTRGNDAPSWTPRDQMPERRRFYRLF